VPPEHHRDPPLKPVADLRAETCAVAPVSLIHMIKLIIYLRDISYI
jgi:hypothetical protein